MVSRDDIILKTDMDWVNSERRLSQSELLQGS